MPHTTLITASELHAHRDDPEWVIVDCRFLLSDTAFGRTAYQEAHIPGAVYAHLDADLSGPILPGKTGRHPLPTADTFAARLSAWGIDETVQVVAYDQLGGAIAARLWWMLRWLGHHAVAVLDGGWQAWQQAGYAVRSGTETSVARSFVAQPHPEHLVDAADLEAHLGDATHCLLDARGAARYRGEEEPIDPVAGHIPGAVSVPFADNLTPDGFFRPPEALHTRFASFIEHRSPENIAVYCGSGVTAAHNALAMVHAGLPEPRLYAGSWSEWITDPARPVGIGDGVQGVGFRE